MREIKFRAWQTERKEMIPHDRISDMKKLIEYGYENAIPMQYIGLKDKNGKEIYEGDIIKTSYGVGSVKHGKYEYSACEEYECVRYGWYVDINYTCYVKNTGYDLEGHEYVEVIGNIYENPELLQ